MTIKKYLDRILGLLETVSTDKEPVWRMRLNVGRSVKGVYTPDLTLEYTGVDLDIDEVLEKHRDAFQKMEKEYPNSEVK